jgi:hypothetical protein
VLWLALLKFLANWECTSHFRGDVFNDPALSISDRSSDNSAGYSAPNLAGHLSNSDKPAQIS